MSLSLLTTHHTPPPLSLSHLSSLVVTTTPSSAHSSSCNTSMIPWLPHTSAMVNKTFPLSLPSSPSPSPSPFPSLHSLPPLPPSQLSLLTIYILILLISFPPFLSLPFPFLPPSIVSPSPPHLLIPKHANYQKDLTRR